MLFFVLSFPPIKKLSGLISRWMILSSCTFWIRWIYQHPTVTSHSHELSKIQRNNQHLNAWVLTLCAEHSFRMIALTIWTEICRTVLRSNLRRHSWNKSSRLFPSRSITMTWYILPSSVFSSPTKWRKGTNVLPRSLWISLLSQKSMIWRCIFTAFSYTVGITEEWWVRVFWHLHSKKLCLSWMKQFASCLH